MCCCGSEDAARVTCVRVTCLEFIVFGLGGDLLREAAEVREDVLEGHVEVHVQVAVDVDLRRQEHLRRHAELLIDHLKRH